MQATCKTTRCTLTLIAATMKVFSRKAQKSAAFIQLCSSNGTMLPMLTWAPLTSHQKMAGKFGGYVISAQMATCTAGKLLSRVGAAVEVALSAQATKCASTIPWPPRLPRLQLNGTTKKTLVPLTMWWLRDISQSVGSVRCVATSGVNHPIGVLARARLAAHNVTKLNGARIRSGTQPLQRLRTLIAKLSWHNGTMSAMQPRGTSLTTPVCTAISRSSGSATNAQRGSSTAGLQCLSAKWPQQDRLSILCREGCLQMQLPAGNVPCHSCRVGSEHESKPA